MNSVRTMKKLWVGSVAAIAAAVTMEDVTYTGADPSAPLDLSLETSGRQSYYHQVIK